MHHECNIPQSTVKNSAAVIDAFALSHCNTLRVQHYSIKLENYIEYVTYLLTCTCTMMDFLSNAACNVHIFPVLV